jgi:hypothetical protein
MTEELIKYIDEQIAKYKQLEADEWFSEAKINNYLGQIEAFENVKKFLQSKQP